MSETSAGRWVQLPLFRAERPTSFGRPESSVATADPVVPPRRRSAYRVSHVRVTSDDDVVRSADQSSRLSAEITWQLARSLSDEQLAELRRRLGLPAA